MVDRPREPAEGDHALEWGGPHANLAVVVIVQAAKGALTSRAGALLLTLAVLAEAAALLHTVAW
jgi:hypothetical protein